MHESLSQRDAVGSRRLPAQSADPVDSNERPRRLHPVSTGCPQVFQEANKEEVLPAVADRRLQSSSLKDAWVAFLLKHPWEWIGTFTFRNGIVHPETANKRFMLFVSLINRELHGPRWAKRGFGVSWVRGCELQRRGTIHFHALFGDVGNLRRLTWMDRWTKLAGFARIEAPRNREQVLGYVSKYVVKGGEIDFGGPWFRETRSRGRHLQRRWRLLPLARGLAESCHRRGVDPEVLRFFRDEVSKGRWRCRF